MEVEISNGTQNVLFGKNLNLEDISISTPR